MTRYLGAPYYQGDGSYYAAVNCVAAGGVELVDMATVGRIRLAAPTIRRQTGVGYRGLSLEELADAVVTLTHGSVILTVHYLLRDGTQRGKLRDYVAAGRPTGLVIDTTATANTDYRTGGSTWTFRGNHFIVLREYRWVAGEKPHAEFLVEDPGTTAGWRWWPAELVYRAAEAVASSTIWTVTARDTEGVDRTVRQRAHKRFGPRVGSADLGPVRLGRTFHVLATLPGGGWQRDNGTTAYGWHKVRLADGRTAYLKGEALA